jgi:hypothetical protein
MGPAESLALHYLYSPKRCQSGKTRVFHLDPDRTRTRAALHEQLGHLLFGSVSIATSLMRPLKRLKPFCYPGCTVL